MRSPRLNVQPFCFKFEGYTLGFCQIFTHTKFLLKPELQQRSSKICTLLANPPPQGKILPRQHPSAKDPYWAMQDLKPSPSIINSLASPPLKERFFLLKPNVL